MSLSRKALLRVTPPLSSRYLSVLSSQVLLSSHLPKGFEKFTNPRPTPRQKEEEKEEDDKPTTTQGSSSKKDDDGGDGGGSSSGKKPQPPSQGINSIQTGLAVGFLLYLMYSAATTEVSTGDLSFQDFLNEFFLKGNYINYKYIA
ncbi:hypothetical protein Pmar_PMAR006659 [Perkinsus marinus ATCC 50983]|uniref:Peptidase M41 FtsH extracellular domain-containing protein n=1 Tax=Perkinsus marinus (strain ATCC 50983 / TXsc) TaxID=423536 RepID=C5LLW5_PERM5|nr:hypothetical protein Pmar_PMAR006659 [Perkinsus marinus ATCC 50983]EER02337.1 hypothetical protein Pmar_PMAR006659 [Perkinsus marinus ATCC 50983]|eukprot:XP_002769619.1 hypothetical protein Pmar_PMAR006659 [Perkinsus marinus ATCC 50983]